MPEYKPHDPTHSVPIINTLGEEHIKGEMDCAVKEKLTQVQTNHAYTIDDFDILRNHSGWLPFVYARDLKLPSYFQTR